MKTISIFELLPGLTEDMAMASKIKVKVAMLIFNARKTMNKSIKDFATIFDVTPYRLRAWESGHHNFTVEELSKISNKLKVDICLIDENKKIYKAWRVDPREEVEGVYIGQNSKCPAISYLRSGTSIYEVKTISLKEIKNENSKVY